MKYFSTVHEDGHRFFSTLVYQYANYIGISNAGLTLHFLKELSLAMIFIVFQLLYIYFFLIFCLGHLHFISESVGAIFSILLLSWLDFVIKILLVSYVVIEACLVRLGQAVLGYQPCQDTVTVQADGSSSKKFPWLALAWGDMGARGRSGTLTWWHGGDPEPGIA